MPKKDNQPQRAGKLKKNLSGELAYLSFVPSPLPPNPALRFDSETIKLLVQAHKQLALLDGIALHIPSVTLFISMYVRKEALMSSQIEGTQATLEDILDPSIETNVNRHVGEVIQYVKAAEFAIKRLKELPFSGRLLKEIHAVLMAGVRGQEKNPGEFRRSQNWIGGVGSTLKDARYIPPSVEDMTDAMSNLEKYINSDDDHDVLIKAALIHYQFETIHPFLDGNGRVGRLLIILFLLEREILVSPVLYISFFLKKNRVEYYDRLSEVRQKGNYEQWVKFFLAAILESAKDATAASYRLIKLHDTNIAAIANFGRSGKAAARLFIYLEENPIIEIQKTAIALDMTFKTVAGAVKRLSEAGILKQVSGKQRNRIYAYEAYLEILKEGTA
jgi:Fic family protein